MRLLSENEDYLTSFGSVSINKMERQYATGPGEAIPPGTGYLGDGKYEVTEFHVVLNGGVQSRHSTLEAASNKAQEIHRRELEAEERKRKRRLRSTKELRRVTFECYWCGGTGQVSCHRDFKPSETCPHCQGIGELTFAEMMETFDGMIRIAANVGEMIQDGVQPTWWRHLPSEDQSALQTLCSNPCKRCGTYLLEKEWVGSAYCSRRCAVEDFKHDRTYAEMILESYDNAGPDRAGR